MISNRKTIALLGALVFFVFTAGRAYGAEPVACANIETPDTVISLDAGARTAFVGHFFWLQYAEERSSLDNIVSLDMDDYQDGTLLTVCTDWVPGGEYITEGQPDAAVTYLPADDVIVIVSTDAPHPQVAEIWIEANYGFYIL